MQGVFKLNDPIDLLKKLEWEYSRLTDNPTDSYIAYNFFVTAEHIPDWLFPKRVNKDKREDIKNNNIALQICSHIANGGKHFEIEAKHHNSVTGFNQVGGCFPENSLPKGSFPRGSLPVSQLIVHLENEAQETFGPSMSILNLAKEVMCFWQDYFNRRKNAGTTTA